MHWAGQCLSLLIKNVIKDLTSRKKCIKKKKRCGVFLLASLLVCSGFYFCAAPSCLPQKNPYLRFPHVLRGLIAKCRALKTTKKKSLYLIQTKYRLSLSSRTADIGGILSAQGASKKITARNKYSKWKEKLSQENSGAPSLPLPQLLLNKWSVDLMLTFPVYSKQHFP